MIDTFEAHVSWFLYDLVPSLPPDPAARVPVLCRWHRILWDGVLAPVRSGQEDIHYDTVAAIVWPAMEVDRSIAACVKSMAEESGDERAPPGALVLAVDKAITRYEELVHRSSATKLELDRRNAWEHIAKLYDEKMTRPTDISRTLNEKRVRHWEGLRWTRDEVLRLHDHYGAELFSSRGPRSFAPLEALDLVRTGQTPVRGTDDRGAVPCLLRADVPDQSDLERVLAIVKEQTCALSMNAVAALARPMRRTDALKAIHEAVATGAITMTKGPNGRPLVQISSTYGGSRSGAKR